jgi:hypothetical protein
VTVLFGPLREGLDAIAGREWIAAAGSARPGGGR